MSNTLMTRSAFDAVKDHQQVNKYDALNSYTLYVNSIAAPDYVSGVGNHYQFVNEIPDNGSSHIKNAAVRVKFVGMPFFTLSAANAYGFINWNHSKNQISTLNKGQTSRPITGFSHKVIYKKNRNATAVPALTTTGAKIGVASPATLVPCVNSNTGQVWDSSANRLETIPVGNMAAIGDVTQDTWTFHDTSSVGMASVADDFDRGWTPCGNPFGKRIEFMISGINPSSPNTDISNGGGENTAIVLEIKLLPDNQANDRFTY